MRRLAAVCMALAVFRVASARAAAPPITNVAAREVTVLNAPQVAAAPKSVASREVIVLNDPKGFFAPVNVPAREIIVLNDPKGVVSALKVLAREVTVQAGPLPPPGDAKTALTLAGGIATATAAQKGALNVVTSAPSATTVDLLDAIRLARKAAGLD